MTDRTAKILRRSALALLVLGVLALGVFTYLVGGPRNLVGMMLYDQREEGWLRVGDPAPDVALTAVDGTTRTSLLAGREEGKAQVLIFGSFT